MRADGKEAWLRSIWQPIKAADGALLHITLCANNLTRTIESSREAESVINALQRSTAVIEFDLSGHVLTANQRFLDGMGYRLEQIQGKHHRMFCEREEAESAEYRAFWERLNRGDFVAARFKRIDALGRPVWLEASYNPVHDAYGKLYKVIKFATVITEQVQREMAVPRRRRSPTARRSRPTSAPSVVRRWCSRPSRSCIRSPSRCRTRPMASRRWTSSRS